MLKIDRLSIVGFGLLLMPLLTMWHEIGGHAAMCLATASPITEIGAFYVDCNSPTPFAGSLVAAAGVAMDMLLAGMAFAVWKAARTDTLRLGAYYVWLSKAFVAAGYFAFSGIAGVGDLAPEAMAGFGAEQMPALWRVMTATVGITAYIYLVRLGIRSLTAMIGQSMETRTARRSIGHIYYATAGVAAVIVGLLNPVGVFIVMGSAAASSLGGLAGFISIGFSARQGAGIKAFQIDRNWAIIALGLVIFIGFAAVLGPTISIS